MAYLGKEYTWEKDENYEGFINAMAEKQGKASTYLTFRPNQKLTKNGDEYTLTLTLKEKDFKKDVTFKVGVPFDESLAGGAIQAKSVVTVDGDTFTQVQEVGPGSITYKREFINNGSQLKVTITSSIWDGTAYRYYVPV